MTRIGCLASLAAFAAISMSGSSSAQAQSMASASMAPAPQGGHPQALGGGRPSASGQQAWLSSIRGDMAPSRDHRRERPGRRDGRRRQGYGYPYFVGYGGGINALIPPDLGYFATGGEARRSSDGHVDYDYDRGYPYDYYSSPVEREMAYEAAPRERYCETIWARGGRSGERVPVTVCRN